MLIHPDYGLGDRFQRTNKHLKISAVQKRLHYPLDKFIKVYYNELAVEESELLKGLTRADILQFLQAKSALGVFYHTGSDFSTIISISCGKSLIKILSNKADGFWDACASAVKNE